LLPRGYLYLAGGLVGLFAAVVTLWIRRRRLQALNQVE